MTQTDTNTRITGLGFYLDEIEKPIFCIFLENHRQTIDAMSASASVRAFEVFILFEFSHHHAAHYIVPGFVPVGRESHMTAKMLSRCRRHV